MKYSIKLNIFQARAAMLPLLALMAQALGVSGQGTLNATGWLLELDTAGLQSFQGLQYGLLESSGRLVPLGRGIQMPLWDSNNILVEPGVWLNVRCTTNSATGFCTSIQWTNITILPTPQYRWQRSGAQNRLVVIMDFRACGCPSTINETEVRNMFLGTVAQRLSQCSYGRATLAASSLTVVRAAPPCNQLLTSQCSPWDIANLVRTGAGLPAGFNLSSFNHFTYVLPPCMSYSCSWTSVATTAMGYAWLTTPPTGGAAAGVRNWATVLQGYLVNWGLRHAWLGDKENADKTTFMGSGAACPSAPELAWLGWASAAPSGTALTSAELPRGGLVRFTLPATYLTGNGAFVRIVTNWLGNVRNLYIAVRVAKGGDVDLDRSYAGRFNVHEVAAAQDSAMVSGAIQRVDNRKVTFIACARGGSGILMLRSYNLVVYGGTFRNDNMQIDICRFGTDITECPDVPLWNA